MITVYSEVEVSYHFDKNNKDEWRRVILAVDYVSQNTPLHMEFNDKRLLIKGDVKEVAPANDAVLEILRKKG